MNLPPQTRQEPNNVDHALTARSLTAPQKGTMPATPNAARTLLTSCFPDS